MLPRRWSTNLRPKKGFTVEFFGGERQALSIPVQQVFHTEDPRAKQAIADADVILVSVGAGNLEAVGRLIKAASPSKDLLIITAENAIDPAKKLEHILGNKALTVTEAAIFCSTIEKPGSSLDILSEAYDRLPYDAVRAKAFRNLPKFFIAEGNFPLLLTRKIFTYNAASAAIAYLGAHKGYTWYADAANDPAIVRVLDQLYYEVNAMLCTAYGIDPGEQEAFALASKAKFQNRNIRDSVERNARDAARKLAADERLLGPLLLAKKHGLSAASLELVIAAAVLYGLGKKEEKVVEAYRQGLEVLLPALKGDEGTLKAIAGLIETKLGVL
jgi:Mannitol-1-phosphate/altronate dehydrogenases